MFKFLFYITSTAIVGAAGFAIGTYATNEVCKDNYGHDVFKTPSA